MHSISDGPDQAILIPSQTTYTLDMGSSFPRVSCKSDCYPACTSTWHKEGGSTSIATTDGLLALGKLNKTDAGVYICNVTNIQLSQAHTAQVTLHIRCMY